MASLIEDLERGQPPILIRDLPAQSFMPRRGGRALHKSVIFRWAQSGKAGVRLETLRTPTGIVTTAAATLRFFSALSDPTPQPPTASPARRQRDIALAEAELLAAGVI